MQGDPSRPVTGYPAPNGFPPPQPGVAYPYHAHPPPPQPPQPHPYYNPQPYPYPSSSSSSTIFVRRFLAAMIAVFFLIGVSILILWLVLRPRLPDFRVDSLSVSNFSSGSNYSTSISGFWNVRFSVYNPNKKISISYDDVHSSLYKSELISQTRIPPFKQGKRNQTVIDASFSAVATYVDRFVVNDISSDRARGSVRFSVIVRARVQFRAGGWRARNRLLRVSCQNLPVGISSNSSGSGTLVGGAKDCRVYL